MNLLDDRLAAPGRRVRRAWLDALDAARSGDTARCAAKLAECTRTADLSDTPFDGDALMAGLVSAVEFAAYWAEPDAEDQGFAGESAREALRPVAEAVAAAAAAPGVRWWTAPADLGRSGTHNSPASTRCRNPRWPAPRNRQPPGWRTPSMTSGQPAADLRIPPRPGAASGGQAQCSPGCP